MEYLRLENIAVGYNGKTLIREIDISVNRGEIVTLVGPNGSGKSTILRSITGQLPLIGGQIFLDGKNLREYRPADLAEKMAVMLTGRMQPELMTCRDVAAMGRYPYTGRLGILSEKDEEIVEETLKTVHALQIADRPFDAVSDGERQRVLLARAICQEPEIIILDEPTSYLDIRHKLELLSILYRMSREQKITVVMSLHEIDLAMKIADRVICVRGDRLFAFGKPAEVLDDEAIRRLYELDPSLGSVDARTGHLNLHFKEETREEKTPEEETCEEEIRKKEIPEKKAFEVKIRKEELTEEKACEKETSREKIGRETSENREAGKSGESVPRVLIAAPGSGSGKTLLTCGVLRLMQNKNLRPASFKCGPDYIDPMFHREVLHLPSRNLDTFFCPNGGTREILARGLRAANAQIAVIEGVMGYFDGTGKTGSEASACDLAMQTGTPVILVVDAKGMGRSVSALVRGFQTYERQVLSALQQENDGTENTVGTKETIGTKEIIETKETLETKDNVGMENRISGILLNRISAGMFPMMKKWIEEDTGLPVVGYLPADERLTLESRHLGLLQPEEISDLREKLDLLAETLEQTLDLDQLLSIAGSASPLTAEMEKPQTSDPGKPEQKPRIAVARDEAFCFYYEDNLDLLREAGAELVFFSPIHDETLPEADGLLLGGGYPELHAQTLEANSRMRALIRDAAAAGMPILAECGGFMYLQESLVEKDGRRTNMCGVLPGTCTMTDRLVRFGYIELEKRDPAADPCGYLSEGHHIRGHEFHYFDSTDNGEACTARKPGRSRSWPCMKVKENIMAGFPHLYYRSDPAFAAGFVRRCLERKNGKI